MQQMRQVGLQPIVAGMIEPVYSQVILAANAFVRPKSWQKSTPQGRREQALHRFLSFCSQFLDMRTFAEDLSDFRWSLSKQNLRKRRIQMEKAGGTQVPLRDQGWIRALAN